MLKSGVIIIIFLILEIINCELLILSLKELHFPALKHYTTDDFRIILRDLGNPKMAVFDEFPEGIAERDFMKEIAFKVTFILNAEVNFEEFDVISHDDITATFERNGDILVVYQHKHPRIKRNIPRKDADVNNNSSSVLFADNGIMIYSKSAPELKRDTTTIILSQCSSITSQTGSNHTVIITIEFFVSDQTTVGLIFSFSIQTLTWLLQGTKLNDAAGDMNLKPSMKIFAPMDYSFHCNDVITFKDFENEIEVKFFSMQVQPYSMNDRVFFPAVDCVPFFTIPILCFLLVIAVFLFGVFLGLAALASIKSIQICDPAKMKKLSGNTEF